MHDLPTPGGARRHLGWLLLLGLGSATVYAAALLRFPLLAHYQLRMQNLYNLTEADPLTGAVMAARPCCCLSATALAQWRCGRPRRAAG